MSIVHICSVSTLPNVHCLLMSSQLLPYIHCPNCLLSITFEKVYASIMVHAKRLEWGERGYPKILYLQTILSHFSVLHSRASEDLSINYHSSTSIKKIVSTCVILPRQDWPAIPCLILTPEDPYVTGRLKLFMNRVYRSQKYGSQSNAPT